MDPSKEVPLVSEPSLGVGSAALVHNSLTKELSWIVSFEQLTGAATAAHLHGPANEEGTAAPQINLDTDPGVIRSGLGSGAGLFIGTTILTDEQEGQLLGFLWYVNIHTALNPAGEIRGQIFRAVPIPEPGTLWMLLPAAGALLCRRARLSAG
jgi:hypothetical protein